MSLVAIRLGTTPDRVRAMPARDLATVLGILSGDSG